MTPRPSSATRKLDELRVLYTLKPHFRDVIVEGRDDAALLRWFFREHNLDSVKVFAVDDRVDVPEDVVRRWHADVNPRGRAIAVSNEALSWDLVEATLTCVVDSDYDLFEPPGTDPASLFRTDYAAMEVYSLQDRPLTKFLIACAKSDVEVSTVHSLLKPAWATIYALRYVLHRHSDGLSLAEKFANTCVQSPSNVVSEAEQLIKLVSPSPPAEALRQLLAIHKSFVAQIPEQGWQGVRGHDIAPLLIRFLGLKNELAQPLHVEKLMRLSLELRDLDEQPMFSRLLERVA